MELKEIIQTTILNIEKVNKQISKIKKHEALYHNGSMVIRLLEEELLELDVNEFGEKYGIEKLI